MHTQQATTTTTATTTTSPAAAQPAKRKGGVCAYFARGHCRHGDHCRFSHSPGAPASEPVPVGPPPPVVVHVDATESTRKFTSRRAVPKPSKLVDLTPASLKGASSERLYELQHNELKHLLRHFPSSVAIVQERPTLHVQVALAPSDVDFPFELSHVALQFCLPPRYPCEPPTVQVLNDSESLPPSFARKIERALGDNMRLRRFQLMVRPTLLWLDKNLEALLTPEPVVPPTQLVFVANSNSNSGQSTTATTERRLVEAEHAQIQLRRKPARDLPVKYEPTPVDDDENEQEEEDEEEENNKATSKPFTEAVHRGIQLRLAAPIFLNVGYVRPNEVKVLAKCERCHVEGEHVLLPDVAMGEPCVRCKHPHLLRFRASTCHSNAAALGYVDASGTNPVDLVRSNVTVHCGNCGTAFDANDAAERACHKCHQPLRFAYGSVAFVRLGLGALEFDEATILQANTSDPAAKLKIAGVHVGHPLPEK